MSGFISYVLSVKYDVTICSTEFLNPSSQVFNFDSALKTVSLKEFVFNKSFVIRLLAFFSYLKNQRKNKIEFYSNNYFVKKYFSYDNKVKLVIRDLILSSDLVFINAQISSNHTRLIIEESKKLNKKLIFRTTGAIQAYQNFSYLNKVDLFIHHSEKNAKQLQIQSHNYSIIDQCAFNEEELLKIPIVKNKVKVFLTIARLEKEKNIDIVIKAFLKVSNNDKLIIIGNGSEYDNLQKLAQKNKNVVFTGFIPNHKTAEFFKQADCIIISHYDFETGPLTGVEAMASARLILSAKTGAMQERLEKINISWFENSIENLAEEMMKIKNLDGNQVEELSIEIRDRYISGFSNEKIKLKYLEVIKEIIAVK